MTQDEYQKNLENGIRRLKKEREWLADHLDPKYLREYLAYQDKLEQEYSIVFLECQRTIPMRETGINTIDPSMKKIGRDDRLPPMKVAKKTGGWRIFK